MTQITHFQFGEIEKKGIAVVLVTGRSQRLRQQLRTIFVSNSDVVKIHETLTNNELRRVLTSEEDHFVVVQQTLLKDVQYLLASKKVLVVGAKLDEHALRDAYLHGACGYLLEDAPIEFFSSALHLEKEQFLLDPTLTATGLQSMYIDSDKQASSNLTTREQEVAKLIREGMSNQAIADQLCISITTVKSHVKHVYEKLNMAGRKSRFK